MGDVIFFKSKKELRSWFIKNHKKTEFQWVGLVKKATLQQSLTMGEANEVALCFGWTGVLVKRIDIWTYKIRFVKRKKNSVWSKGVLKKFQELQEKNLVHTSGLKAYAERNRKKPEEQTKSLSKSQLAQFKANKKAWAFFQTQTQSYQKYMVYWVTQAKREETQAKRLGELIADSAEESKLKRVLVAIEKTKPKYAEGQTPVEEGRNLGITTGADLRSVEISTLEQLKRIGWEKALTKVCEIHPHRLNLIFFCAVIGAVEEQSRKELDPDLKAQAKDLLQQLKQR